MKSEFIRRHHYYFKINRNLIPIKIAGFINSFGSGAIMTYLTIQAKSLGLSTSQIGMILAMLPIAVLLGPPIFSPLADKLQKHKLFLIVSMLLAAAIYASLNFIPPGYSSEKSLTDHSNMTNFTDDAIFSLLGNGSILSSSTYNNKENATHNESGYNFGSSAIIKTLVIYAIVRLLAQIAAAATMTFTDAVTLGLIDRYGGKHNQRLGINRFWHTVGGSLGAPVSGLLIDYFSKGRSEDKQNYLPGFIINGCAALVCATIVSFMEVTTTVKPKKVLKNVGGLLKQPDFAMFLVAVIVVGKLIALKSE